MTKYYVSKPLPKTSISERLHSLSEFTPRNTKVAKIAHTQSETKFTSASIEPVVNIGDQIHTRCGLPTTASGSAMLDERLRSYQGESSIAQWFQTRLADELTFF